MAETFTCPNCGGACDANFVDIGVGEQRVEPWHCHGCGWAEPTGPEIDPAPDDEDRACLEVALPVNATNKEDHDHD